MVLLAHGTILDGTGAPRYRADLLVSEGRIAAIGSIPAAPGMEVVDCTGLAVAPGFVDVHSHGDQEVLAHLPNKVLQGVTTEVVGNCGFSLFPSRPNPTGERLTGEIFDGEPREGMDSAADYFGRVEEAATLVNVAALTGHGALRLYAARMRRDLSDEEIGAMERALDRCLEAGSIGLSTGLNCAPSSFGDTEELVRLCRVVARRGAHYATHLRDYKFRVLEAVDEALELGRRAGVPVQFSHLQVVGRKNWDKLDRVLDRIETAAREGVDVGVDAYPYLAGSCNLTQFLPSWCQEGGVAALLHRLASPELRDRIARETDENMSNTWDDIVVCNVRSAEASALMGRSIQQVADERGRAAVDTALDLLSELEGFVYIISFNQSEENLRKVLTYHRTAIITDGMVTDGTPHPRTFGTYPKFLGEYVREKRWLSLEEAIVRTGALQARRFGLAGRGVLEPRAWADIAVFDPQRIGTRSDYERPACDPEGVVHVLVNGRFVVRDGRLTGARPGTVLRRGP